MKSRPPVSLKSILLFLAILIIGALAVFVRVFRPDLLPHALPVSVAQVYSTPVVGVDVSGGDAGGVLISGLPANPVEAASTPMPEIEIPTQPVTPENTVEPISLGSASAEERLRSEGVLILAMRDGNISHLFAYHPLYLPLTRLTQTPWDDQTPAVSPDGKKLAYSSRQNGYWDLYVLDLETGQRTRLTDTPEYEASPSWSPDGQWVAFERFNGANLDIYIQAIDQPGGDAIQLTNDPGIDRSPAWSPQGREIAFVSTRSGDEEIWLARLDDIDNRFANISRSPLARDHYPVWTAGGEKLAWASERGSERIGGERRLAVWEAGKFDQPGRLIGEGDMVAWSPDSAILFSVVQAPNHSNLAAYSTNDGRLVMPFTPLPGSPSGMSWVKGPLPAWLEAEINKNGPAEFPPLWEPVLTRSGAPAGRSGVVPLQDVTAPQPMLHDATDESFNLLRQQIGAETGWDALSSLENAYVALTSPSTPSMEDDWLFTGRAFALNPLLHTGGWMAIAREDFAGKTYWRVYLKARYQDGSMGAPIPQMVWEINARFAGDTKAYEQGGRLSQAPAGYWVDLTELAGRYGWERLPSWVNWRSFYPAIRFNQFAMTGGLDWFQAMSQLYPPEAMITATPLPTYTQAVVFATPTLGQTSTPTPTVTLPANRRPTWTPLP